MIERIITLKFSSTKREFSENLLNKENFSDFFKTMTDSEKLELSEYLSSLVYEDKYNDLFLDFYYKEKVNKENAFFFKDFIDDDVLERIYTSSRFGSIQNSDIFNFEERKNNNFLMTQNDFNIVSLLINTGAIFFKEVQEKLINDLNIGKDILLITMLESIFTKNDKEIDDLLLDKNTELFLKILLRNNKESEKISKYFFNKSDDFLMKIIEKIPYITDLCYFNINKIINNNFLDIKNSNKPNIFKYLCENIYSEKINKNRDMLPPLIDAALSSLYFYSDDVSMLNEKSNSILSLVEIEDLSLVYRLMIHNEGFKDTLIKTTLKDKNDVYKKKFNYKNEQMKFNSFVKYFQTYIKFDELEEFVKNNFITYKKIFDSEVAFMSKKYHSGDYDIYEMTKNDPEIDNKIELVNIIKLYASIYFEMLLKQDKAHQIFKILIKPYSGNNDNEFYIDKIKDLNLEEELGFLFYKYENEENLKVLKINCNTGYQFIDKVYICYEKSKMNAVICNNDEIVIPKKKRI